MRGLALALVSLIAAWGQTGPGIFYDGGFAGTTQGSGLLYVPVSGNVHSGLMGLWDGEPRVSHFEDGRLRIGLAPGDLARAGMHEIRVRDPVTGAVSNPLPFHVWLPRRAEALAYDAARDRLYAADGETLLAIDLARGAVLGETHTGEPFLRMRVSGGGAYLYAMTPSRVWRRFDLLDEAPWLGPGIELFSGYEIAPMPGAPESFAAVTGLTREQTRIAIYDGVVPRPRVHMLDQTLHSALLTFDGQGSLGAYTSRVTFAGPGQIGLEWYEYFHKLEVTSDGVASGGRVLIRAGERFTFLKGRAFTSERIYDAAGQLEYLLPGYPVSSGLGPAADDEGRVAYVERLDRDTAARLTVLDAVSLEPLWSLVIPPIATGAPAPAFIGLGKGRFAYTDPERGIVCSIRPRSPISP